MEEAWSDLSNSPALAQPGSIGETTESRRSSRQADRQVGQTSADPGRDNTTLLVLDVNRTNGLLSSLAVKEEKRPDRFVTRRTDSGLCCDSAGDRDRRVQADHADRQTVYVIELQA